MADCRQVASEVDPAPDGPRPKWDPERQELRVGDLVVKQFKVPAANQERILAAFEADGWPVRSDDPQTHGGAHAVANDRLSADRQMQAVLEAVGIPGGRNAAIGVGLLGLLLQPKGTYISFLIGAVVGFFLPRFYVKRQQAARIRKFDDQLGDMLNLMVNGLRAGYSIMQAMEAISRELPAPISDEFHRVVQEMQIGIPMEKALDNLFRRIPSDDLDFVITAINVQREVGGNLSEILDTISFTIRERVRIKGEIRVMTASVRSSGVILSLIPVFLALALWFISPEYIGTFFAPTDFLGLGQPWCGILSVTVIVGLILSGYFVMMKIADIEV